MPAVINMYGVTYWGVIAFKCTDNFIFLRVYTLTGRHLTGVYDGALCRTASVLDRVLTAVALVAGGTPFPPSDRLQVLPEATMPVKGQRQSA